MHDGDVSAGPASARRDFSRSKRGGRKKGSAIPRNGGSIREKRYTKRARRKSPEIAPSSRRDLDLSPPLAPAPFPQPTLPVRSPGRPPSLAATVPLERSPTDIPNIAGTWALRRDPAQYFSGFELFLVLACVRTERRVTQARRDQRSDSTGTPMFGPYSQLQAV